MTEDQARDLLSDPDVDYRPVVRPYLTAKDITDHPSQTPGRWTIDFGLRPLEDANRFPKAIGIAKRLVKPERESNRRKVYREKWWIFAEPRTAMRGALAGLPRFIALPGHAKRMTLTWMDINVVPSNATDVFAFADDYSMGILLSRSHDAWAWAQASTLKGDLRYTPTSVFMTFPWPDPVTDAKRERVSEAARQLLARRIEICTTEQIGLTKLYNAVDEGAWADLKALHRDLDEAVADCYDWPRSVAQDGPEIVRRLTELNRETIEGRPYAPFNR